VSTHEHSLAACAALTTSAPVTRMSFCAHLASGSLAARPRAALRTLEVRSCAPARRTPAARRPLAAPRADGVAGGGGAATQGSGEAEAGAGAGAGAESEARGEDAGAPPSADEASASASDAEGGAALAPEDLARLKASLRDARGGGAKESLWEGVAEEVRLIKWPAPQAALLNTLLVVALVAGTSALLLGINALLSEASSVVYAAKQ
jgi:preprotein translocase subunit SecE